jgi:myo-inositol-1(or 4)-monophosphatase
MPDALMPATDHTPSDRGDPAPSRFADELDFAVALAAGAGDLLVQYYERIETIAHKGTRDVVTEADHASEALVIEAIRARFPGDAILAEESGAHDAGDGSAPTSGHGRAWVVDPLDGTINYANGIPFFCVSIGFVADGVPVVGVVRDPIRGETFAATADGPARLSTSAGQGSRLIAASDKERLIDWVVSMSLAGRAVATRTRAVRTAVRMSRSMGSAALACAYVANGRFDAFIQQTGMSHWDIAAAGLIAERAGATVTAMDGGPWFDLQHGEQRIGAIAAPSTHHATLLSLVQNHGS